MHWVGASQLRESLDRWVESLEILHTLLRNAHCRDEKDMIAMSARGFGEAKREREKTHVVVGSLDAVVAQPAVTRPRRPIRVTSRAPCGGARDKVSL